MRTTQPAGNVRNVPPVPGRQTGALAQAAQNSPAAQSLAALQRMADQSPVVQNAVALQRMDEDELQGKFIQRVEEDELQMKPIQRMEEDELQGKAIQRAEIPKTNNTGLPGNLKSGIEHLSGMSMDHVKVHRDSDKPAAVQAYAYAQGSDIHLGPGQEQHLPHEAWHVVQQAQGRVKPTVQLKGVMVNDDVGLETEADVMGATAMQMKAEGARNTVGQAVEPASEDGVAQRAVVPDLSAPLQMAKQNPQGNLGVYEAANVVSPNLPPTGAEVAAEGDFTAVSNPTNTHGWGAMQAHFICAGGHLAGGAVPMFPTSNTRVEIRARDTGTGSQLTRMHLIHHRLAANANNNINNMVLGPVGFNNDHRTHVESFLGDSMDSNFYFTSNNNLSNMLLAGEATGITPVGHANAGVPYVVGNPLTFPATMLDGAIGVLAATNGVPAHAHAISTDEDVLDDHLVLWYEVTPVYGLAAATILGTLIAGINAMYAARGVGGGAIPTLFGENGGANAGAVLTNVTNALAAIYATSFRIKGSFFTPDPESIPAGGSTADQIPWHDNRIPGRTIDNNHGNPYARLMLRYDGGPGPLSNTGNQYVQL